MSLNSDWNFISVAVKVLTSLCVCVRCSLQMTKCDMRVWMCASLCELLMCFCSCVWPLLLCSFSWLTYRQTGQLRWDLCLLAFTATSCVRVKCVYVSSKCAWTCVGLWLSGCMSVGACALHTRDVVVCDISVNVGLWVLSACVYLCVCVFNAHDPVVFTMCFFYCYNICFARP